MTGCHLSRLPVELHLGIIEKLELQDRISLASANYYFRAIIPPPTHTEFLDAEADLYAKSRGLFACSGCARFRCFEEFADNMKKGKRTRGGPGADRRLCLRCGANRGLYLPGTTVVIYGKPHVLCQFCMTFTDHFNQGACTHCSPGTHRPLILHYAHEHGCSDRSASVYSDRPPMDELYGFWPNTWLS
jgi:hypothetical protein